MAIPSVEINYRTGFVAIGAGFPRYLIFTCECAAMNERSEFRGVFVRLLSHMNDYASWAIAADAMNDIGRDKDASFFRSIAAGVRDGLTAYQSL